jgi:sugar phosphate isomerase/epimerase
MTPNDRPLPDRRAFLRDLAAMTVGGGMLAACAHAGSAAQSAGAHAVKPSVDRIGLQLYTVGDQLQKDFDATLERVAQIGYKQVEFAGYGGRTPEQVRATLDRLGLKSPSTHIGMDAYRRDMDAQIHIAQVIGHEYLTIPSLGRTETPMNTVDAWKRIAAECNALGARAKAAGIKMAFHSHWAEFTPVGDGKTGMDVFVTETDPALFNFQMDLGWARVAGQDPLAWFHKYPGRFRMWHVKDMENLAAGQARSAETFRGERPPAGAPNARPTAIGTGDIDYRPILTGWRESGMEYFFVEQDGASSFPGGSIAAIETSYKNLRQLLA